MKKKRSFSARAVALFAALAPMVYGQATLSLQQAVDEALASRPSLRAEAERIAVAQGLRKQASALPNPEFQFQNENLRPGQSYTRDVDTLAMISQTLDVLGKRPARVAVADAGIARSMADRDLARWEIVRDVRMAYWAARGAQEVTNILKATADDFQKTVDYHAAQLSAGAIAEQDLLRVRLERERVAILADIAGINAGRSRADLFKQMGRTEFSPAALTESLSIDRILEPLNIDQVLAHRPEIKAARAAVAEAEANVRMQDLAARPDVNFLAGYKRTELPDTSYGVNTAIITLRVTLPVTDKNVGNRMAAQAEVRRRRELLAAIENGIRMEFSAALAEFRMRRAEVVNALQPLREHAANISQIASAAYTVGGVDLLRFLDAERARLEGELELVRGTAEYWQSVARLEAAEGVGQ